MSAKSVEWKKKSLDVSKPQRAFLKATKQRNLFMAGVGSGKSHCAGIISAHYARNYPQLRGFIGANTYSQLTKSTLDRVFSVWKQNFGWERGIDYVVDIQPPENFTINGAKLKKYDNTISFKTGHLIFTASLENYKAIDGTEFAYAILDETKDTKEEAVKEVIMARLRQPGMYESGGYTFSQAQIDANFKKEDGTYYNHFDNDEIRGFNPLYVLTSPAKVEWINKWFEIDEHLEEINQKIFSKTDFYHANHGKNISVTISSTFHNEHNLSKGYIDNLIDSYKHNPSLVDMLIYGSPIAKSGGEYFNRFDRTKHVGDVKFNPDYPVHISLDFNVVPYMTMLVSQFVPDKDDERIIHWNIIQEYCLKNPLNNTEAICMEFMYDYAGKMTGLFYTGDPSGKARTTVTAAVKHNYETVENVLRAFLNNGSDRVLKSAPPLVKCRDFFNRMFSEGYNIRIHIDKSCTNLITDMEFLKEDVNGGYKKPKTKDPMTGESYEKYGHCGDAFRYQGVAAFKNLFNQKNIG